MRVSIIVPTLNEEALIAENIRNLEQLSGEKEIIVVDGGSTDQTITLVSEQNVRVLGASPGRGPQMHAGALASAGDVLWFIHADILPSLHALEDIRNSLKRDSVVGGNFGLIFDGPSRAAKQLTAQSTRCCVSSVSVMAIQVFLSDGKFTSRLGDSLLWRFSRIWTCSGVCAELESSFI